MLLQIHPTYYAGKIIRFIFLLGATLVMMPTMLPVLYADMTEPSDLVRFYVSLEGNDSWSGLLPEPNTAQNDGPFATIQQAQQAIRTHKQNSMPSRYEVSIREGVYYLESPIIFQEQDSGTAQYPVVYQAHQDETVVISGGKPIQHWVEQRDGTWKASMSDSNELSNDFHLLRVNDQWAHRARHPNYNPDKPITGGWLFADYGGNPWEQGTYNRVVHGTSQPGTQLTWEIQVPASGTYTLWMRYGMVEPEEEPDTPNTYIILDSQDWYPCKNFVSTGNLRNAQWSAIAELDVEEGTHTLSWINEKGGEVWIDMLAMTDDSTWNPEGSFRSLNWWGQFEYDFPNKNRHLLLIQAEACTDYEGEQVIFPEVIPPGTKTFMRFYDQDIPRISPRSNAQGLYDLGDAYMHIFIAFGWVNAIIPLDRMDYRNHLIYFDAPGATQDVRMGNRYFLENHPAFLDAPGEWYASADENYIAYIPTHPAFPDATVVVPQLTTLIDFQGNADTEAFVEHIHIRGLQFMDTDYSITDSYYSPSDAAIIMAGTKYCLISDCSFTHLGGYALKWIKCTAYCQFLNNTVTSVGQGGVIMQGDNQTQPHHCQVIGNSFQELGKIYKHIAGIYVTTGSHHYIAHNDIHDVPRYAISLKGFDENSFSHGNIVEFNDIRRCNKETNDTGAIETLGREKIDTKNIIRYNLILDSIGLKTTAEGEIQTPYFSWGIYLDDYSSGTEVYGNIVARNVLGGLCIHGGKNNIIQNNIFVQGENHQIRLQPRDDFMRGNIFLKNIIVYSNPESQLIYSWDADPNRFIKWDLNIYWGLGFDITELKGRITPLGDYETWLDAGFDSHSYIADPLFVDMDNDDYRLRSESPAFDLGFERIPVERIGVQGAPE